MPTHILYMYKTKTRNVVTILDESRRQMNTQTQVQDTTGSPLHTSCAVGSYMWMMAEFLMYVYIYYEELNHGEKRQRTIHTYMYMYMYVQYMYNVNVHCTLYRQMYRVHVHVYMRKGLGIFFENREKPVATWD